MVEALRRRPCGKRGPAIFREPLLKGRPVGSGLRIARRHGTPRARIAALEMYFADAKAHRIVLICREEPVFPERRHAADFKRGAEAAPGILQLHAREEIADRLEAR